MTLALILTAPRLAEAQVRRGLPEGPFTLEVPPLALDLPEAKPFHDEATRASAELTKGLETILKARQAGRLAGVTPEQFTRCSVAYHRLRDSAQRLQHWGEPSGLEFQRRATWFLALWEFLKLEYRDTPACQKFNLAALTEFQRNERQRLGEVQAVVKLIEAQKFPEAEKRVEALFAAWKIRTALLPTEQENPFYEPINTPFNTIALAMEKLRRAEAAPALAKRRDELLAPHAPLLALLPQATASLRQSGKFTLDGQELDGPAVFAGLARKWKIAHLAYTQALAVEWSRVAVLKQQETPESASLVQGHQEFDRLLSRGLGELIAADGERAGAAGAAALHAAYLDQIASLAPNASPALLEPLRDGLAALAENSPELARDIAAYESATTPLLYWREQAALGEALARRDYRPTTSLLGAAQSADQLNGMSMANIQRAIHFLGSAPEIVSLLRRNTPGMLVSADRVATGTPGASRRFTAYAARTFSTMSPFPAPEAEIAALRIDLLLTSSTPAPALDAAASLAAAAAGGCMQVGGQVVDAQPESLVLRFATLPPAVWNVVPLGELPAEPSSPLFLEEAVLRFDLQPHWIRHRHFIADLPRADATQ